MKFRNILRKYLSAYGKKVGYIIIIFGSFILSVAGQEIPVPENYSLIASVYGDLDKDGQKELVAAYNTEQENDRNVSRELIIYKKENGLWRKWKNSSQVLYGSKEGGMLGDPFERMEIKNGILLITQSGGSRWKWEIIDKYRYQNGEFYLIGYTSFFGAPCEYWEEADFNLSTGKILVKKEFEKCGEEEPRVYKRENETFFKKGIKITLQNRQSREIKITSPKYGYEIYVATGQEE